MIHRIVLVAALFCGPAALAQEKAPEVIAQAQSAVTFLKAIKENDVKLFKSVFSQERQKAYEKYGWNKVFQSFAKSFKRNHPDFKVEDFTFKFKGDEESGTVMMFFKGDLTGYSGLRVVKEDKVWKVHER